MEIKIFDELYDKVVSHYNKSKEIYIFDGYAGSNKITRKKSKILLLNMFGNIIL